MTTLSNRIASSIRRRLGETRTAPLRKRLRAQMREIDDRGFAVVSNNCIAGILYDLADLPKVSPTAGIYFRDGAFVQFLNDLSNDNPDRWRLVANDLVFEAAQSCWAYQAGTAGRLVFLHYPTAEAAASKWTRRLDRLRTRRPIILGSTTDGIELASLRSAQEAFPFALTVAGDPAPPADDLILNAEFLNDLSSFFDRILSGEPSGPVRPVHRYS